MVTKSSVFLEAFTDSGFVIVNVARDCGCGCLLPGRSPAQSDSSILTRQYRKSAYHSIQST